MKSVTESCVVSKPKDVVFDFLSNFENMPKWSTRFVKKTLIIDGKKKAITPLGEVFVRIDSDRKSGIIDIYAGPTENQMNAAFMRVISFSDNTCGVMFTFFKWPETTDQMWETFCEWIKIEVGNIKKLFS
ncbi:MAG: hypothetical protein ACT4OD_00505 [Candidatus Nitrosotenuis sp.]